MITLVTVTLPDGRAIRAASQPCTVQSQATGAIYQFSAVLLSDIDFEEEVDIFSLDGVAALSQATVELVTPDDLAALQGDWHPLAASTGEIAIIEPGQWWEDRRVILSDATLQSLELGVVGEPTSFVLESIPPASGNVVGDLSRDLVTDYGTGNTDDIGDAFSDLTGYRAPIVIGRCYAVPAFKVRSSAGVNYVCIAGHRFPDTTAVQVYVDGVAGSTYTPGNATGTSSGQDTAEISDAVAFRAADGAVTYDASSGGIAARDKADAPAVGAREVVEKLLSFAGIKVDWVGSLEALGRIEGYDVGVWVDEPTDALAILRSRILPFLPVFELQADGLRLVSTDAHRRLPQWHAIAGQSLVGRVGGVEFSDFDEIYNRFQLRYSFNSFTGEYEKTAILDSTNSALCYFSRQMRERAGVSGVRTMDLECDTVWADGTAWKMLQDLASRYAVPRRAVRFLLAPDFARRVRAGDVGTITCPELGLSSMPCMIRSLRFGAVSEAVFTILDRTPVEDTT